MPQIDFGKAFAPPKDNTPDSPASLNRQNFTPENVFVAVEPVQYRNTRLGRSDWTNFIFVLTTVVGGLFCAFYFFNGAEVIHTATRWPSEYLYPQPDPADNSIMRDEGELPDEIPPLVENNNRPGERNPFQKDRTSALVDLGHNTRQALSGSGGTGGSNSSSPSTPSGNPPSSPPGGGLSNLPPGTDQLTKTLNQEAATIRRIAALNSHSIVVIEQRHLTHIIRQNANRSKAALSRLQSTNPRSQVAAVAQRKGSVSAAINRPASSLQASARAVNPGSLAGGGTGSGAFGRAGVPGGLGGGLGRLSGGAGGLGGVGGAIRGAGGRIGAGGGHR